MPTGSGVRSIPLASFLALLTVIPALGAEPDRAQQLPAGASSDWWTQVQRSIQLEEYGIAGEGTEAAPFRASNPSQKFEARFDADGVRIAPTTESSWEWRLQLTDHGGRKLVGSLSAAGSQSPLAERLFQDGARAQVSRTGEMDVSPDSPETSPARSHKLAATVEGDRLEFDRGLLTERFVNTPDGLEHGFSIPGRPRAEDDQLVLDLTIAGGLRPVFAEDGRAIDFYSSGNVSVLRYGRLAVTDGAGNDIPARMEPIAGGLRIVVDGANASYPLTVGLLATSASWTAVGQASGNQFGASVATAGDVNGDGYSDVVVGALSHTSFTGKAYLYLGGTSGLSTTPAWSAVGEATGNQFGGSVATAGDVNGDGYSDVIVGAFGNLGYKGKAYVYLGGASGLSATASWTGVGEATSSRYGCSVATAGDVNGDGRSDVVVGAYGNASSTGKAYVYLGGVSGLAAAASWTASGEAASNFFGASVATAGDVNGDGRSDVVVGAYGNATSRGKAYLYLGTASGLAAAASWTTIGESASNLFGFVVATAGDVNGDGYADVVVGAYGNATSRGKAYLYLGTASGLAATASWTAIGEAASDVFGAVVATAGDVNGDGYSDVAIGAYGNGSSTGKAYLYLGGATGLPATASWTAIGEGTSNFFGRSLATAGDVNGDGRSDLVIGADGYSASAGKTYVYLGGASGLSAATLWSAAGEATGNKYGTSVASAGDLNGDGYSDVVVGAPGFTSSTGKVYVYLGGAAGLPVTASWTEAGEFVSSEFGGSVASAGDVNGDGYSDLVIAARTFNQGAGQGKVYLYPGGASGLPAAPSWTKTGADFDGLGWCVASAGDVNGDGFSDVIIGSMAFSVHRGRAQLYLGSATGLAATPSWTKQGEQLQDEFGTSVAGAGDVDGDGYADVVIGAGGYPGGGGEFPLAFGRAYLFKGGPNGLATLSSWTVTGERQSAIFGGSVASAGDVNGDGYSDVIVGAYQMTGGGKVYLYLGRPSGLPTAASWTLTGEGSGNFGNSVASAGDINGDGYSDVVVGAPGYNSGTGKTYLYLGSASGLASIAAWTAGGEGENNRFGFSVAPAGDVNGDGYADVVVGADRFSSFNGKAYLYFGGGERGGVAVVPRQLRSDQSTPLGLGGAASGQQFAVGLTLRSPAGRVRRMLQWQAAPRGNGFAVGLTPIQSDLSWFDTPVARKLGVSLNAFHTPYIWRARTRYSPANSPFVSHGPWFTMTGNSQREADFINASGGVCTNPTTALFISNVDRVGGKPDLTYHDLNPPAAVTGYNVYRAAQAAGPWSLVGSNVGDTDPSTPGLQYVDQAGDVGSAWYYKVTAYNAACGVEGP